MIDPKLLRTDPERIRQSQRRRGGSVELVDELIAADDARRAGLVSFETLRAEQKDMGRKVARASGDEKAELLTRTKQLAQDVKAAQASSAEAKQKFDELVLLLGNIPLDGVPDGGEEDAVLLETHGTPRDFADEGFEPKDHLELGELLGAIDMERGTKISGSRFYVLTGVGAQLEFALLNLAMAKAEEWGFTPIIPPALVKPASMEGTGFLGQAAQDVYHLPHDDLYLVGTSEVALAAFHSDEILPVESLPRRYVAFSPCFRREAGSYGKDTRGIFRVHWFDKVEMFVHCLPEDAADWHEKLVGFQKDYISALELPFQVVDLAAGDLGLPSARTFDCNAWLPTQGRYREITSTSNCTQFQARRLGIRYRNGKKSEPLATLNGTLVAMTRVIIMLLENHQQADGSIRVPAALQPFLGGREVLEPIH